MADADDIATVRLLIADTATEASGERLLSDTEITSLLTLEGDSVKLAAAQALDAIASSEALVSKVIKSQDLSTDGAKTADSLRKHAAALRAQSQKATDDEDEGYFEIVDIAGPAVSGGPELAAWWP